MALSQEILTAYPGLVNRHRATQGLVRWLYPNRRLPDDQYALTAACWDLAMEMVAKLPDGQELSAGLRKLLEAKDCFVRSSMEEG